MSDNQLNPKSYRAPVEVTFTFPEDLQMDIGYKSVTLRELKASAESRAISRANGDGGTLINELVKECVVCAVDLDGTTFKVSTADESIDILMDRLGPKGRSLLAQGYASVNQPKGTDAAGFLKSASAKVA